MYKIVVVENSFSTVKEPKTKDFLNLLKKFVPCNKSNRALLITHEVNENLTRSARNIPNLQLLYSNSVNLKEILLAKHIIITQDALKNITSK